MRGEGEGEDFWLPFFSTTFLPSDFFCATGVARPADGNRFDAAAGLILVASLSGCRAGARVETTEMPDETRCRDVEAPPGPDPVAPDVDPFLAVVPTVRVLTVESVEPPDVLRDRAEVGVMSSDCAVRKVLSDVAEEIVEFGRTAVDGMRRVDRPFVPWWGG